MITEYDLGTKVTMKKQHACGENKWQIIRVGADIKIKCLGCQRMVMMPRGKFEKDAKKIILED